MKMVLWVKKRQQVDNAGISSPMWRIHRDDVRKEGIELNKKFSHWVKQHQEIGNKYWQLHVDHDLTHCVLWIPVHHFDEGGLNNITLPLLPFWKDEF